MRTSVWLLFAASLPLTVIGLLLGPRMLRLMQVPADAMPGAEKEAAFTDFLARLPAALPHETAELIMSFALSFTQNKRVAPVRQPEEKITIG